jgi:hypothetical protein
MKDLIEYLLSAGFAIAIIAVTYSYLTDFLTSAIQNAFAPLGAR